jgi:hypothetical protein
MGNILCFSKIFVLLKLSFYIAWIVLSKDMVSTNWIAKETYESCRRKIEQLEENIDYEEIENKTRCKLG